MKRIGVFDSGLGGLTVLHELLNLGCDQYIYVGDTARMPYGQKTADQIITYSHEIAAFLYAQQCDALVVACHTSSAIALPSLQKTIADIPIIGTIAHTMQQVIAQTKTGRIGIMATQASIASHMHKNQLLALNPALTIFEQPCPALVPLIEAPVRNHGQIHAALTEYLAPFIKQQVDTILLGCTHYQLLRQEIQAIVGRQVHLVSCEKIMSDILKPHCGDKRTGQPQLTVYATGDTERFAQQACAILGRAVTVEKLVL